jgi:Flp pilus assembly protein TadD/transglutaminase-like putative cysteine protease
MRRPWFTLWFLILTTAPALFPAQQQTALPAPQQSATAPSDEKKSAPDYSQEPFVVEQFHTTARFENDGTGERDAAVRIHVQSDAGVQQLGELVFGYSSANEQMDVRYVRIRKADGTVVTAAADAVKEMTAPIARDAPVYTDYKEKHITVPSLHPGDTLEYDIATRLVTPLAPGQFWFDYNFVKDAIVLDERLDIDLPKGRVHRFDGSNDQGEMVVDYSGDREIHHWKHSNLARPTEEEQARKKSSRPEEIKPDIQFTTFPGWEDVARWYAKLEKDRTQPTPEIRARTQELIEGRKSDLDKMQALYDYVSKNIRYVSLSFGLGRYQPHSAEEVLKNQYGDCKDKHTLLAAMLQAAGIPSDAVLIPSTRKLDASFPSPSQFDHVITAVPHGDELVWMDSTAEVAPFRLLVSALRGKSALLVPPDGAGKIVETPADPPFPSTQRVEIEGQVSDLGKLTAKLRYFLRGDNELALRAAFRRTPQTQWKELGQTIAAMDGIRGNVTSIKPSDPSDTREPFEMTVEYSLPNFIDWSSKKAKVALPLLTIGLPSVAEDNTDPIKLGSPLGVVMTLKLTLPASFTAQPPVAVAVSRDYAEFKSSYRFADHILVAERSLNFKIRELPASRTGDYMAFTRAVESDESQVLSVENSSPGTPAIPSAAKADELIESGLAALNAGNVREAVPLFQRAVEIEPQHKQAWNYLGIADLRLGQFDSAAAAFRKQIEVNLYDEHAYDYLGIALAQQRKFDDAATAYRKQIELNPLDTIAHAGLGALYLEQHKYADAVPELDKATILSPDDAGLQVSLGQAYLNTGEKDKALAAFEKGAELSQTPIVWNNVAYSLADHHLELDKAMQYAESAVAATTASLRNVELSRLTIQDLGQVVSLGAYWDTLGWVYFQKGDLATAERYVDASWKLNQHGEVADHLAQIYEKSGGSDSALHSYALAAAAPHSVPETRARLAAQLKVNAVDPKIDQFIEKVRPELLSQRSFVLKNPGRVDGSADFLILLAPDKRNAAPPTVETVKFVGGSEALRSFADQLSAVPYGNIFPDAAPVKLVRRGTLKCSASADCSFTLILPEDVRTVN